MTLSVCMLLVIELLGGVRKWSRVLKSKRNRLMKVVLSVMEGQFAVRVIVLCEQLNFYFICIKYIPY